MKPIVLRPIGHNIAIVAKELKGDQPLLVVTPSRVMVQIFEEHGFTFIRSTEGPLPELGIMTNLKFRASPNTRGATIVASCETMLHSTTTRFSREFRKSSHSRLVLASMINPEKTWAMFKNLGIHNEAFGQYDSWLNDFTNYHADRRGFAIIRGMKNLDALQAIVRKYVRGWVDAEPKCLECTPSQDLALPRRRLSGNV